MPSKSYGVQPLILLGSGGFLPTPCLTGILALFCLLFFTFWVTSLRLDWRSGELRSSQFYPMFMGSPKGSFAAVSQFKANPVHGSGVTELNSKPKFFSFKRNKRNGKKYKIAGDDWLIQFLPDPQGTVPPGDVEIHSELNDASHPGFQGAKTTLIGRDSNRTAIGAWIEGPAQSSRRLIRHVVGGGSYLSTSSPDLVIPCDSRPRILRGLRFATTITLRPMSFSGS